MADRDPRSRLLDLAARRGVSLAALSGLIGRNPTYLQQFVRKGSPRKLEEQDRRKLAEFLGASEAELGGPAYFSNAPGPGRAPGGWLDIPRLDVAASAGPGAYGQDDAAIGTFRFSARWLREQGFDPAMLSAIRVAGDSMEPLLRDGDEILVDRTPRPLRDGIHVVRIEDSLLVKRVQTGVPGQIVLESQNPAYRPIVLKPHEVEVIGRVVWKSGRL
ncbi:S24 family peptidase [Novosphingobium aerophilum]|uniref:LexA family transcriptional regulator n=1 Tax=Novosphingobium aerophilum TaxID=2839843 RepID=A0A7X1KB17_9SPHN|nr:LexA family transcriptional regulator [Novosphingobium aerophilum]MBC2650690.1 LexA family transcriptional regulator [Novosphingobium aerophilum]